MNNDNCCIGCEYWNEDECYCTYIACDGLDCDEFLPCEEDDIK